jgi:hypothetical protein
MTITVLHNQSLLDLAVQEYGTAEAVVPLALANGLTVTGLLVAGQQLRGIDVAGDAAIVRYYSANNIKPATATTLIAGAEPDGPEKDPCDLCQFFH